jgi:hypothetical protein
MRGGGGHGGRGPRKKELTLVSKPTQVIVTKQILQISDYFKNFHCIVEAVKEHLSLKKQ